MQKRVRAYSNRIRITNALRPRALDQMRRLNFIGGDRKLSSGRTLACLMCTPSSFAFLVSKGFCIAIGRLHAQTRSLARSLDLNGK